MERDLFAVQPENLPLADIFMFGGEKAIDNANLYMQEGMTPEQAAARVAEEMIRRNQISEKRSYTTSQSFLSFQ